MSPFFSPRALIPRLLTHLLWFTLAAYSSATQAARAWTSAGSAQGGQWGHSTTLLPSGRVLVVGGEFADIFDPSTKSWTAAARPTQSRSSHTATLLDSGHVLVAGGSGAGGGAEIFDFAANTWTPVASMTQSRYSHTATLLPSGKVLVAGGISGSGPTSSAEVYDPNSGSWSAVSALPTRRFSHSAVLLQTGEVLVAGGNDFLFMLSDALLFNPQNNSWRATGSLTEGRGGHSAIALPSGHVLVMAGFGGADIRATTLVSSELYNPSTGQWSSVAPMPQPRRHFQATALTTGEILVTGGLENSNVPQVGTTGTLLFNPSTNAWQVRGPMSVGRYHHTAIRLQSGEVLAVGGSSITPHSAELFAASRVSHQIAVSSQGSGSLAPNSNVTVLDGDVETFTVSPAAGHTVSMVGSCAGTLDGSVFTTGPITDDCTVEAQFTVRRFTVSLTAGAGGSVLPASNQTVNFGETARFEIAPSLGYVASVGGTCAGSLVGNTFTTEAIEADCSVVAQFANPAPTLTTPAALSLLEDQQSDQIAVQLADFETPTSSLVLSAVSSNQTLISDANLSAGLSGANSTRFLTLRPTANQFGSATITLSVSDGNGTNSTSFALNVVPVNDAPTLSLMGNRSHGAVTSAQQRVTEFASSDPGPNEGQSVSFITTETLDEFNIVDQVAIDADGTLSYVLTGNVGTADLLVVAQDDGGTANGGKDESPAHQFRIVVGNGANLAVHVRRTHPLAPRLSEASAATGSQLASYEIRVTNNGPNKVSGARLLAPSPEGLKNMLWECSMCTPTQGSANIDSEFDLDVHQTVSITLSGRVDESAKFVEIVASAELPNGVPAINARERRVVLTEPIASDSTFRNGLE